MRIEQRSYDLNGHILILRSAEKEDAKIMLPYLKRVCGETRFLLREADECKEMTLEQVAVNHERALSPKHGMSITHVIDVGIVTE